VKTPNILDKYIRPLEVDLRNKKKYLQVFQEERKLIQEKIDILESEIEKINEDLEFLKNIAPKEEEVPEDAED